ncbi:MAG: hypothetical protein HY898_29230 [Deltaproteobacteria bacterium]|nr:hypothetical protein [Deltaproteobacteria bacterium]
MQLTPGVHWVRMFHAEAQGSTTANEALVDNVESVDLQSHMADFAWPRIEAYCSTRLFLLLQDQLDVSQALATMAQWSTTNEDRMRAALVARGASASHAEKLVCLVPLAFGRPILARLGVSYSDTAVVIRRGDQESTISLLDEPIYVEALRLAQSCGQCGGVDPTLFRQISVLSAEIDAVNNALSAGVKVENMRFKPLVLYWSEAD